MAKNFSDLKKRTNNATDNLNDLVKRMDEESSSGSFSEDTRFWKLEVNKAGNGSAVIRFLDEAPNEDVSWVKIYSHEFQGVGGWYIDKCLTTIGGDCPVCAANRELWETGTKENQDIVRKRKRKLRYISNILVVSDPAHPENDGKVFLYRYGTSIYNKIKNCMRPQFEDESPRNPFDFWTGCNFKLRQVLKDDYPNFDQSVFETGTSPISTNDEVIKTIWESQYPLLPFQEEIKNIDPAKQAARLAKVLKAKVFETPETREAAIQPASPRSRVVFDEPNDDGDDSGDELNLDFFRKLAKE